MTTITNAKATKIEFLQFHEPTLPSGDYTINLKQNLSGSGIPKPTKFESEMNFSVLGNRYTFPPTLIHSFFPPKNDTGSYSNVLPHIILNRSTIPWERYSNVSKKSNWLALLVFDETELVANLKQNPTNYGTSSISYGDFKKGGKDNIKWPMPVQETGTQDEDRLLVLDVPFASLQNTLPSVEDLNYLTHVRQNTDENGEPVGKELAVIVSNRLPKQGVTSIVHLVSLEGRVDASGNFNYQGASDGDFIRLVSLYHWKFASLKKSHTFSGLLLQLNKQNLFNIPYNSSIAKSMTGGTMPPNISMGFKNAGFPLSAPKVIHHGIWDIFDRNYHYIIDESRNVYDGSGVFLFTLQGQRLTNTTVTSTLINKFKKHGRPLLPNASISKRVDHYWWIKDGQNTFFISSDAAQMEAIHISIDNKPTLRLPDTGNANADKILENGYVPMPHQLRKGGRTVSWYRGPLSTIEPSQEILPDAFPVSCADELLRYDSNLGMLDVSYAAAWELGRLLMLKSKLHSIALWQWKRHHQQLIQQIEQFEQNPHLASADIPVSNSEFPQGVEKYLSELSLLKGIPFNYLVPDERQLPKESIRYFNIDPNWIECLIDGAFSLGSISHNDQARDAQQRKNLTTLNPYTKHYSGFIMHSAVVKGWPGLEIAAYDLDLKKEIDKGGPISPSSPSRLNILSKQYLAPDILLVIFEGDLKVLDIHLKPEVLHFGVDVNPLKPGSYQKAFRNKNGVQDNKDEVAVAIDANRKLDVVTLFGQAKTFFDKGIHQPSAFTSAQFGLCMVEGVQMIRFLRNAD